MVEDRVRTNKSFGLQNLPSRSWRANRAWLLAASIAADLDTWNRLLGLATAEPRTMRFRIYDGPARLVHRARGRWLHLDRPALATAFQTA